MRVLESTQEGVSVMLGVIKEGGCGGGHEGQKPLGRDQRRCSLPLWKAAKSRCQMMGTRGEMDKHT